MHFQVEVISKLLIKAFYDGLFNNLWYYIKDFNNYKLLLSLEITDEFSSRENEYQDTIIIGELNKIGFKDIQGNYHLFKTRENNLDKISINMDSSKYEIQNNDDPILETENNNDKDLFNRLISPSMSSNTQPKLIPSKYYISNEILSTSLPTELLYKVEEAILHFIFSNNQFSNFLTDLQRELFINTPRFDSYLSFTSQVYYNDMAYLHTFLGMDTEAFDCTVAPLRNDIIEEVNKILNIPLIVSEVINLPYDDLLSDLIKIERLEAMQVNRGIVLREYHRLIERLGNFIFSTLYDQIQKSCKSVPQQHKRYYGVLDYEKGDKFKVTNLNQFSRLLNFLACRYCKILGESEKKEIVMNCIPVVQTYEGFSKLRNYETHDSLPIDINVLNSGVIALKHIILKVYSIIHFLEKGESTT